MSKRTKVLVVVLLVSNIAGFIWTSILPKDDSLFRALLLEAEKSLAEKVPKDGKRELAIEIHSMAARGCMESNRRFRSAAYFAMIVFAANAYFIVFVTATVQLLAARGEVLAGIASSRAEPAAGERDEEPPAAPSNDSRLN